MPISEDEFDSRQEFDNEDRQNSGLSKAELRKTNKPIMEKKRRARINQCLGELKDLILEAMKKDPARHSKLEKADILEMTVRHLQSAQRRGLATAAASDPGVLPRFRQGFSDCAAEATRFLSRPPALPTPARTRLRQHLAACVASLHHPPPQPNPHDLNGNIHMGGVPLIPSRLPTGELALVLPSSQLTYPPPISDFLLQKEHHLSAFQTVKAPNRPPSPSSSITSCDSLDSEPATPPRGNLSTAFPTPPSQKSFNESSPETQKAIVSSTTITPDSKIPESKLGDTQNKTGIIWRQTDVCSYKQLTPPSANSSGEIYEIREESTSKIAIDYSTTPSTGKRRMHLVKESNVGLLSIAHSHEPPIKVRKFACTQVSSSQSPEEHRAEPRGSVEERTFRREGEQRDNYQPGASGSSTSGGDSMWRPW